MSALKNIIKNSIYLYLVHGINLLLPILILPYLLKTLSTESFGKYSFAFAFAQLVILFIDFGFNLSVTKKIAENNTNESLIRDLFWKINIIKLFFLVLTLFVVLGSFLLIENISFYQDSILLSYIMILGTAIFPSWWFQGLNKMKTLSIISLLSKILTYPLIFIFVKNEEDSNIVIVLQSLSIFLSGLFSLIYIYIKKRNYFTEINIKFNIHEYIVEIKEALPIFLSNSSISLYTNSLTILLGFFSSPSSVGLFGAMERIVRAVCFSILGPINQACFPILINSKNYNFNEGKKIFKSINLSVIIILFVVYSLFYCFKDILIEKYMNNYNNQEELLSRFMLMIFPIVLGGILGQLGLLGLGGVYHKKIFSRIYIVIGIVSFPLCLILIKFFDVYGAVYSMMIVEVSIFLAMLYFNKKFKFI